MFDARPIEYALAAILMLILLGVIGFAAIWYVGGLC